MNAETSTGAGSDDLYVVVGAGPIGSGVALALAELDLNVRIITRSGSGPSRPSGPSGPSGTAGPSGPSRPAGPSGPSGTAGPSGPSRPAGPSGPSGTAGPSGAARPSGATIERVAADASDATELARLTRGAAVIYNCVNPPYHRWPAMWPPIARSLLGAAQSNGAVLVTISNLYGYGPAAGSLGVSGYDAAHPMTPQTPLAATGRKGMVRAQMWREALTAHQAGRVRVVEVRASDYVGPGAQSVLGERVVPRVLRGKGVSVLGKTDRLHTWSFTEDVIAMAVVAGRDPRAWGQAWHAPSGPPRTQREAVDDIARAAGLPPVPVRAVPSGVLRGVGLFSPLMRELTETEYQFRADFVMDSVAAQETFGLKPAPWGDVMAALLQSFGWPTDNVA